MLSARSPHRQRIGGGEATCQVESGNDNVVLNDLSVSGFDLSDTSGCQNTWSHNRFATADAVCIE